jgi:antitoxin MazE
MKVAKWGNSLAVRLPAVVVEALELKEGDEIEIDVRSNSRLEIAHDRSSAEALERFRKLARRMPPGFKFDRMEANER